MSVRDGWDSRHGEEIFVKFVGVCIDQGEPQVTGPLCRGVDTSSGGGGRRGIFGGRNGGGSCEGKRRVRSEGGFGGAGCKVGIPQSISG